MILKVFGTLIGFLATTLIKRKVGRELETLYPANVHGEMIKVMLGGVPGPRGNYEQCRDMYVKTGEVKWLRYMELFVRTDD